jgi:hypothetical protein
LDRLLRARCGYSPDAPMLLGAITVLVVLAAGDARDPTNRAMEKALRTALGGDASVVVRRAGGETDAQLLSWASAEHANLLGIVTWSDELRRVTLRFVHPSEGRWADREIRFDAADAPAERGRTVGFAVASMVADDAIPPPVPPPPAAPPSAPSAPGVVTGPVPPVAAAATPPVTEARPVVPAPAAGRTSLDASGTATSALSGYGGGVGGAVALRHVLASPLAFRVALGARFGDVAPAQATSRVFLGAAGLAWQPWVGARRRVGVGLRVDALLIGQELVHLSADDASPDARFRVLAGADAAVEAVWRFVDQAALAGAVGTEIAFGRTDVYVRDRQVAELAPVRAFGEAGVRIWF